MYLEDLLQLKCKVIIFKIMIIYQVDFGIKSTIEIKKFNENFILE